MPQEPMSSGLGDEALVRLADSVRDSFTTVEDMTKAFIREAILKGVFRPGQRLQQDAIADMLGVSRMPVRASLRQLETEGLVSFSAHRGASVTALSTDQIAEIYELRILLEGFMLEHAMKRIDADGLEELRDMAVGMDHAADENEWRQRRQDFYLHLYSFAGRPQALDIVRRLRSHVGPYLLLRRVVEEPEGHVPILSLIEDGDIDAARSWLSAHLAKVSAELQHLVERDHLSPDAPQPRES